MEIFYTDDFSCGVCRLNPTESAHCVKVLRHRAGDEISVIDGNGSLYRCRLTDASASGAVAAVESEIPDWGSHPYRLSMAVCPTKNMDRYEWFVEKGTEFGMDEVVPVIGEHSERKVVKTDRLEKILLSAAKQSLKGRIPKVSAPCTVSAYIRSLKDSTALKFICYCFEDENIPRLSMRQLLADKAPAGSEIVVLIGPEGDFSKEEAALALEYGFAPVHLGPSRLRTETAAVAAVASVYLNYL